MLTAFARAFKTPDLRKKLLFTLAIIALYRLGSNVPTTNMSTANINSCINFTKILFRNLLYLWYRCQGWEQRCLIHEGIHGCCIRVGYQ